MGVSSVVALAGIGLALVLLPRSAATIADAVARESPRRCTGCC